MTYDIRVDLGEMVTWCECVLHHIYFVVLVFGIEGHKGTVSCCKWVHRTGGNRSYRSGPVPVPAGSQPVEIQNLNLNSKNEIISQNSQKILQDV
jgi:hypothetical protein